MRVATLSIAPVKGLRTVSVPELRLTPTGPAGDRALVVVDERLRLLPTRRNPQLAQVQAAWRPDGELELRLPGGEVVAEAPRPAAAGATRLHGGRRVSGRLVGGRLAGALSDLLGRPVSLLALDAGQRGADDHPVTAMSRASLSSLVASMCTEPVDARRFRMTIELDGGRPWDERGWRGRRLALGQAVLRAVGEVPRCVVITRDPESGRRDLPLLHGLARLHGRDAIVFGVWCEVERPGIVRMGDELIYK